MTEPKARIIADSITEDGARLTTMEVKLHRFVLAELNTHRVFSRNSASSRAIPAAKQIERVWRGPMPVSWPAEQRGMQGGEELVPEQRSQAAFHWRKAREDAIAHAQDLMALGVHKSVTNRILEPFMWHTVVITATAWENFFAQRCSPLAQPEIRAAAELMKKAYDGHKPVNAWPGTWHVPYTEDEETLNEISDRTRTEHDYWSMHAKISAARCARVSYLTQDGRRDIDADLKLYDRLVTAQPAHWSPLEHVATPWPENRQEGAAPFQTLDGAEFFPELDHLPKVGNLVGWRSLRTEVEAELKIYTYV